MMKVLMISLDRGMFGGGSSGDVVSRHQKYADRVGSLDVIIFSSAEFKAVKHSKNFRVFPSESSKISHFRKAVNLAVELAERDQYDLLVTQEFAAPAGWKIKNLLGLPWIVSVHSMFFSHEWLKLNPINWYLFYRVKEALKRADGFRVNNGIIEKQLIEWGVNKPILVQPTAIDVSKFFSKDRKPKLNQRPAKILFVGRLSQEKNLEMLINAVKNLPSELSLEIVGAGPEEARLKNLAAGDPRISFIGAKPIEELPAIFQKADIFVLPSNTESFGQVLLQASAASCAIIATRTTGAESIIQHERNGLLTKVGDEQALYTALEKLINDRDLRNKLAENARKQVEQYNANAATERLIDFWKKIAK